MQTMDEDRIPLQDSGLKMVTSFFGGLILAGLGAFIAYPHDLPTKTDLANLQASTQRELEVMQALNDTERDQITDLRVNVAKIAAKLNIADGQVGR
jgi:hypothetical protein